MSRPVFMISIETPGANAAGLFTGALVIDDAGYLLPGIVRREGEACAAIDAAWKAPTLVVADRVAGLLIETMHPGHTLTLIELHPAEDEQNSDTDMDASEARGPKGE